VGKVREATVRYTTVEPNRYIEFEAMVGPITPTARLTFEQANGGTKVTFRGEPNPVGPLKIISPLISRQGQRMWDKRLAGLRKGTSSKRRSKSARVRGSGNVHEAVAFWCCWHSSS
jgi:hypothetical protein